MIKISDFRFSLGVKVRDVVTGFCGVTMARTQYATGCNHYGIQSMKTRDGKIPELEWLDENRLCLVSDALKKNDDKYTSGIEPVPPVRHPR